MLWFQESSQTSQSSQSHLDAVDEVAEALPSFVFIRERRQHDRMPVSATIRGDVEHCLPKMVGGGSSVVHENSPE